MKIAINDYMKAAVDWVIDICAENGLKYRYNDFRANQIHPDITVFTKNKGAGNIVAIRGIPPKVQGVRVVLSFDCEHMGKRIKAAKNNFYSYSACRIEPDARKCVEFFFTVKELDIHILGSSDSEESKIASVIDKVKKLLAKADLEQNPSEHEAMAASMMAQRLLAKYNLEIEDVTGKPKEEEISQIVADVGTGNKWKFELAEVIARSYCCRVFYLGHDRVVFYGFKSDALIARRVYMYLFNVGNKLARKYIRNYKEEYGFNPPDGTYNDYTIGFTDGINKELSRQCKALALVIPSKVQEEYKDFSKDFGSMDTSVSGGGNYKAYEQGKTDGRNALNAQYIEKTGNKGIGAGH